MARFQFKLGRLLRVREIGEELARAELAAAQIAATKAAEQLASVRQMLANAERELEHTRARGGARAALVAERTLPPMLRRIVAARQRLMAAERAAQAAQVAWQARRIDVRALEKLRERARGQFHQLEREREDRALAENIERRAALSTAAPRTTESRG